MRSIQKVVIQRADGMNGHHTMRRVTFIGDPAEEQGNQWLREIAQTAPQNGYVKTNVQITFSNGDECEFRFDVQHISRPNNDTDIRQHVRSWLLYHCRPDPIADINKELERIARNWKWLMWLSLAFVVFVALVAFLAIWAS